LTLDSAARSSRFGRAHGLFAMIVAGKRFVALQSDTVRVQLKRFASLEVKSKLQHHVRLAPFLPSFD
jgi:hypothetical protein